MTFARAFASALTVACSGVCFASDWPQWGGPQRNFQANLTAASAAWPEGGPRRIWERPLGDGYSAIIAADGRLYTQYRAADGRETVVALDADSGKTVWEHAYAVDVPGQHVGEFGKGPRATPLVAGNSLVTVGVTGVLKCLDRSSGAERWSHNLLEKFGGTFLMHGYAASPLLYKDKVIVAVGGDGHGLMAFKLDGGGIAWGGGDYKNSYSSPILIDLDGQPQIVALMAEEVVGMNPDSGEVLWTHAHKNQWSTNCVTPLWLPGNVLLITTEGTAGTRALQLARSQDKTEVKELWAHTKLRVMHSNLIADGDFVLGSSGDRGAMFLVACNYKTGEILFKQRGFKKTNIVGGEGRYLILDEDGELALAKRGEQELVIASRAKVLGQRAWTAPTVVGGRAYLRDSTNVMAVDLQ